MTTDTESPTQTMIRLSSGFLLERALYAVTKLDIADHLKEGHKSAGELAKLVGVESNILHRLMRAVAGMGVFHQDEEGAFSLTHLGETLRSDVDASMRSYVLFCHEFIYPSMGAIISSSKSATPGFDEGSFASCWKFAQTAVKRADGWRWRWRNKPRWLRTTCPNRRPQRRLSTRSSSSSLTVRVLNRRS